MKGVWDNEDNGGDDINRSGVSTNESNCESKKNVEN
jgi:hypothetical protein